MGSDGCHWDCIRHDKWHDGKVNKAVFDGAKDAVTICIGLISVLVFWLGLMKIAEEAGLLKISYTFMPIVKGCFQKYQGSSVHGIYSIKYDGKLFGLGNRQPLLVLKRWNN